MCARRIHKPKALSTLPRTTKSWAAPAAGLSALFRPLLECAALTAAGAWRADSIKPFTHPSRGGWRPCSVNSGGTRGGAGLSIPAQALSFCRHRTAHTGCNVITPAVQSPLLPGCQRSREVNISAGEGQHGGSTGPGPHPHPPLPRGGWEGKGTARNAGIKSQPV